MAISNPKYWNDLLAEGRGLSACAEGQERDFMIPLHAEDRERHREIAELYRRQVGDSRHRNPDRPEHQLQDVIDAYRFTHPQADRLIGPRGEARH